MNHLNEQEFAELLAAGSRQLGERNSDSVTARLQAHALECPKCATELARMRESLNLFREATTAYADAHLVPVATWHAPAHRSFGWQPVYWAAAAAALLLTALLPTGIGNYHPSQHPVHPQVAAAPQTTPAESDDALLDSVNRELSESVPTPMAALADPTGSGPQTSQNFTQRTN